MNNEGHATWRSPPKPKGKRLCPLNCQETFIQRPRRAASIIRSLSFLQNSTPSKTSRWLQYFIYSTKGISWNCRMLDALMKWDAWMISTIASFIGWFIILLISASQRQNSGFSRCWSSDSKVRTKESHCKYGDPWVWQDPKSHSSWWVFSNPWSTPSDKRSFS